MTEDGIVNVVKEYFPENNNKTAEKLNNWVSQEGYWAGVKRRQVNNVGKSERLMNLVKEE
jgi:hypothetical protein